MSSGRKRTYRSAKPLRTAASVLGALLALVILVCAIIFFSFRKYIVYTADGLRLEVPWLEETMPEADAPEDAQTPAGGAPAQDATGSAE